MEWSEKEREKYRVLYRNAERRNIIEGIYVGMFGEEFNKVSPEIRRQKIRELIKSYPQGIKELDRIEHEYRSERGMAATLREMEDTLLYISKV